MDEKWEWYWRVSDLNTAEADCGIYVKSRVGLQAICRCPRYLTQEQWAAVATHICDLHNAAIA